MAVTRGDAGRLVAAGLCLVGLLLAVVTFAAYPGELAQRTLAGELTAKGQRAVAATTQMSFDQGRGGLFVSAVRATFPTAAGPMTTQLRHVLDTDPPADMGWVEVPRERWVDAPSWSRYSPPVTVLYLPGRPSTAVAEHDVDRLLRAGAWTPWAGALLASPALVVAVVRPWRRWLLRGFEARGKVA